MHYLVNLKFFSKFPIYFFHKNRQKQAYLKKN